MGKKSTIKYALKETDFLLYFLCILTSAFGALMVHSATRNDAIQAGEVIGRDCLAMIIAAATGMIICLFISFLDYDAIVGLWPLVVGFCLLFLGLCAFCAFAASFSFRRGYERQT